jgi:hypothetical protein
LTTTHNVSLATLQTPTTIGHNSQTRRGRSTGRLRYCAAMPVPTTGDAKLRCS